MPNSIPRPNPNPIAHSHHSRRYTHTCTRVRGDDLLVPQTLRRKTYLLLTTILTTYHLPLTTYYLLLTTYYLPGRGGELTTYPLLLTTYYLPGRGGDVTRDGQGVPTAHQGVPAHVRDAAGKCTHSKYSRACACACAFACCPCMCML